MRVNRSAYLAPLIVTVIWGSSQPVCKLVLNEVTPFQLVLLRTGLASVALVALTLATDRWRALLRLRPKDLLLLFVTGLLGYAICNMLGNNALLYIPASVNSLLLNSSPLFIALGAPILLHERLTREMAAGILVATLGMCLVTYARSDPSNWQEVSLLGVALSLGGSFVWAVYTIAGRPFMRGFDAISISALMSVFAALFLLVVVAAGDGFTQIVVASVQTKLLILYLGLCVTAFTFTLWYYSLKWLPAAQVGAFQYLTPCCAVVIAYFLLGETITAMLVVGMALTIAGLWLVQSRSS